MVNDLELNFINDFIVKEKKDRLIHEFSNPKKRKNALMRFSHNVENIVNNRFIHNKCNIDNLIKSVVLTGDVLLISLDKINGETCSYKEAINHLNEQYMPVIIIGQNTAIIKSENEDEKDNILILTK
ncbi:MAG: hypothetical protein IJY14_03825 [Acholeplasmatales bacterium]|nr:hypothetical protein [Acholeplasmatales bacterium]